MKKTWVSMLALVLAAGLSAGCKKAEMSEARKGREGRRAGRFGSGAEGGRGRDGSREGRRPGRLRSGPGSRRSREGCGDDDGRCGQGSRRQDGRGREEGGRGRPEGDHAQALARSCNAEGRRSLGRAAAFFRARLGGSMPRTKIVCTIGPASRSPEALRRLAQAGMDVARLNFSHGSHEEHAAVIAAVRAHVRTRPAADRDSAGPGGDQDPNRRDRRPARCASSRARRSR